MNLKNLTKEAQVDLFKQLVSELELANLVSEEPDFEFVHVSDTVDESIQRAEHPDWNEGLSTGYPELDQATGGFANGELVIMAGGTGQGKSLFAASIMLNMALANIPTLFFTLEMPEVDTTSRFLKMSKAFGGESVLRELPIYYYHGTNVTLPILDHAVKMAKEQGMKAIFVDHLHFFAKGSDNQANEIGHIVREIKLMARKYDLPIILISHIRKTGAPSKIPTLEDLKDSSGISQDADMVLMIWRNMDSTNEEEQKVMKVRIRKNRRRGILTGCQYRLDENNYLREEKYGHADVSEF